MNCKFKIISLFVLVCLLTSASLMAEEHSPKLELSQLDMSNAANPLNNLTTGGQPSFKDLELLAHSGVKTVINLRTNSEFKGYDEKKAVESLGMKYISIEVDGSDGINLENANKLDQALANLQEPTLLHCASSNRVGGLLAYRAYKLQGQAIESSLQLGKAAGMRSTENKVRALIGVPSKE